MLGLLLMTLLPVAIVSILPHGPAGLPHGPAGADEDAGDAAGLADDDGFDDDGGFLAALGDGALPPDATWITDFQPGQDRLELFVHGRGDGAVTTRDDPLGRGTLVSYDGAVVALVAGHAPGDIGPIGVVPRDGG